jgi:hypothetical protein
MQNFAAFSILFGVLTVLGWSYITPSLPEDDLQAYNKCTQLHPQRYCAITYAPSKMQTMGKN